MQSTILPPFSCPIFFPLFEFRSCHFFFFSFFPHPIFFFFCVPTCSRKPLDMRWQPPCAAAELLSVGPWFLSVHCRCNQSSELSFSGFAVSANVGKSIIESGAVVLSACVHHCVMVFYSKCGTLYCIHSRHLGGFCYPPAGGICILKWSVGLKSKEGVGHIPET